MKACEPDNSVQWCNSKTGDKERPQSGENMPGNRQPGCGIGDDVERILPGVSLKQFLVIAESSNKEEQEICQQAFVLKIDQRCQCPAAETQGSTNQIAEPKAEKETSCGCPGQLDLLKTYSDSIQQQITEAEGKKQGHEPEPVLAVWIGDVEIG